MRLVANIILGGVLQQFTHHLKHPPTLIHNTKFVSPIFHNHTPRYDRAHRATMKWGMEH